MVGSAYFSMAMRSFLLGFPYLLLTGNVQAETIESLETINVISTTPLHGAEIELNRVPSNVQTSSDKDIEKKHSLDLTEYLNTSLGSVFINEAQNNPLQPDLQYRGFVASPLIGLPQGLAVYQDGVRINEPFGDTVNWVLMPQSAISSINLMPGSNPLFGLNALGGALSIQTKNGFTHPGTRGKISGGSFGRYTAQAETGGVSNNNLNYFLTAEYFDEDGWRDFSPSKAKQFFGDIGWQGEKSSLHVGLNLADTKLIGNGPAPVDLQEINREAVFTLPDITENELAAINLRGNHSISENVFLDGIVYYRKSDVKTFNGDDSDFEECEEPANAGFVCEEEGGEEELALDQNGNPIVANDAVEGGTINRTATDQDSYGSSVQASFLNDLAGHENQFIIGASIDQNRVKFNASTELGSLDSDRGVVGANIFLGEAFTRVDTDTNNYSFYFTDTYGLSEKLDLTLSGRYNNTEIILRDQLGIELNGEHKFSRFNPAAGITYRHSPVANLYASYSESSRAPTPMELTCADEDAPCRLPNAFLSDPPLEQVVAKTIEAGIRGNAEQLSWNFGLFRTTNEDDILFISAGELTGQGFFDNIGETQRQGVEIGLRGNLLDKRFDWSLNYSYLEATFEENFTVSSPNNPAAINGEIPVEKGDRLPGLPEHLLKISADYHFTPKISAGTDLHYSSDLVYRGDEGNFDGTIDGYTVVNLRGDYQFSKHLTAFIKINNIFDKEYDTFGLYGEADEVLGDEFQNPRFHSPGAPRAGWVGLKGEW